MPQPGIHPQVQHVSGTGRRRHIPADNFYTIDGVKIGIETGMGPTRINTILQSAFFKLANIIPEEDAIGYMKTAAEKTYGRKGRDVVEKNWAAIDAGAKNVVKVNVPESWGQAEGEEYDVVVATGARQDVHLPAQLHMRSAVSQSTFPYGLPRTASSVLSAPMYALTLQSVLWL